MITRGWLITWISLLGTMVLGAVPSTLTYQGRLLDNLGHPISGSVSVSVGIYTNDQGGTAAYVENVGQVVVQNSIYSFQFGTNSVLFRDVFARPLCWLEVVIDGDPLSPRQKLLSVPYAVRSSEVDSIGSNTTFVAGIVQGTALADSAVSSNKLAAGSVGVPHLSEAVDRRYVKVTGDTMTGSLLVSNNVTITGTMIITGMITNATYYGNGVGLTNIPASAVAEADPRWVAASNGIQSQIDGKTPLATYQAGTGSLWTAVNAKAAQSAVVTATNDLWTALGNETAVRGSEDVTLSNQVAALQSGKLASNIWAVADSTTNYVRRTGDTVSGVLNVSSNLNVSGGFSVGITQLVVLANGNVGIGTSDPTNRLAVNGTIKAREVLVTADNWPDYVFDANYKQMPLDEVAVYIQNHGHLPGVPSANDIDINGVGLGAMQGVLLKKIEELTLQMIELKKENAEFRKRLDERNGSQGKRSE